MKKPRALAFINNKGGVGKTTLSCNMAYHLSQNAKMRVLFVDLDPQCNATQLLISDDQWDNIFGTQTDFNDRRTILYTLSNVRRGDSGIESGYEVTRSERFKLDVLPGHPGLALLEDTFSSSWEAFQTGDLGGARRTHWVNQLIATASGYDIVMIDVGPSLGALNRTVLIGSDYFVTPTAADLFSLFALENIGEWIQTWSKRYARGVEQVKEAFPEEAEETLPKYGGLNATYLGYTIQQYVTKARGGELRDVHAYDRYKRQIPTKAKRLATAVGTPVKSSRVDRLSLGIVPHMFSMVPLAQAHHAPIASLTQADGLRGAQFSQQSRYAEQLDEIGRRLARRLSAAEADEL
jgi:cellulose biosynthesis protein BcsQ